VIWTDHFGFICGDDAGTSNGSEGNRTPLGPGYPIPVVLLGVLESLDELLGLDGLDLGGEAVDLAPSDLGPLAAEKATECVLVDSGCLCELGGVLDGLGGGHGGPFLVVVRR
jgi:hypothetical protein